MQADLNDKESLRKAIKGAYGVYAVTNFWDSMSEDKEITQGKNIADVCKVHIFLTHLHSLSVH